MSKGRANKYEKWQTDVRFGEPKHEKEASSLGSRVKGGVRHRREAESCISI
jgi:hypothetical protein